LFGIGIVPISLMIATYVIDVMAYGEWMNGKRIEGPLASINSFATKAGPALASGVTGLIMGLAGYDGLAEVQQVMSTGLKPVKLMNLGRQNGFPAIPQTNVTRYSLKT
jgi:Na+/melibiose symporter-like transporter